MATRRPPACDEPPETVARLRSPERHRTVRLFRALGEGTRLEILRFVAAQPRPVCVCEIVDLFPVGQPTVSHHLAVLRKAGLVRASRRGLWSFYDLDPAAAALVDGALTSLSLSLEESP